MSKRAEPLRSVVGDRVRAVREAAGIRQQDLADEARSLGLDTWTRTRVAAIERGDKPISVEELVLIVALLSAALDRPVDVAELFDTDKSVRLSKVAEIPARALAEVLHGAETDSRVVLDCTALGVFDTEAYELNPSRMLKVLQVAGVTSLPIEELSAVDRSMGEADERARRTLGEVAGVYIVMCRVLWGRSLSAERDARLESGATLSPASLAARRGRVTRELLAELRQLQTKIEPVEPD